MLGMTVAILESESRDAIHALSNRKGEEMMNLPTHRVLLPLMLFLLPALLLIGCSQEADQVMAPQPPAEEQEQLAEQLPESPYPEWTDAEIESGLIPGFEVLKVDVRAYGREEGLDDQTSRFIRKTQGGTVSHRNNGVQIGAWQLWEDRTITVSTPNPGYAIVDFNPHPYRFNGCIRIWLDLNCIQLPPGRRWDEVAFFYQDTNGQLVRYWGALDLNARTYSAWPDHFSRYIISLPTR